MDMPKDTYDWEGLWKRSVDTQITPGFDVFKSHPVLVEYIEQGVVPSHGKALVPGCGRGYDVATLASATRFAVGLDLSATGVDEARKYLSGLPEKAGQCEIVCGDFFAYGPAAGFDFIYDLTFLCALPPALRTHWAAKMAELLKPGGVLLALQFPLGPYGQTHPPDQPLDYTKGPPYLLTPALYHELLDPYFECKEERPVPEDLSPPQRRGEEAVAVWVRKA